MSFVAVTASRFHLDIFIPAAESPTRKPLRVRKRMVNVTEAEATKLHAEIETALRRDGQWRPASRAGETPEPALPKSPCSERTLSAALELAWNCKEEGWCRNRDGRASFKLAQEAIAVLGTQTPCAKVTRKDFAKVREGLEAKGNSERNIQSKQQALYRVLHFAMKEDWITARPFYKRPKINNARLFTFSPTMEKAVLDYWRAIQCFDMCDLFVLGVECGFRLNEVLTLEGKRVALADSLVLIPDALAKNGQFRQVVATERAREVLRRRMDLHGQGLLFPTWTKGKVSDRMIAAREYLDEEDNREFCFHATRHTAGTRMAERGVPLAMMMEQLGHKTAAMTMRYLHMSPFERRNTILKAMAG